jgi:hypothetical protein
VTPAAEHFDPADIIDQAATRVEEMLVAQPDGLPPFPRELVAEIIKLPGLLSLDVRVERSRCTLVIKFAEKQ